MSVGKKPPTKGSGARTATVRLRTAKGRPTASQLWLVRQLNDPYVQAAKAQGFRSRAAFKLIELDDRFKLIRPGARVVDLGGAFVSPGFGDSHLHFMGGSLTLTERAGGGTRTRITLPWSPHP